MSGAASWTDLEVLEVNFRCGALGQTYSQVALLMGTSRSGISGVVARVARAAGEVEAAALSDDEIAWALDRFWIDGFSADRLAKVFAQSRIVLSRNAVLCLIGAVLQDVARSGSHDCVKPRNDEVLRWPSWWRAVSVQGVVA